MGRLKTNPVTFVVLRYMRRPLLVLIVVYAISMTGWILIPGIDEDGNLRNLSFFHAFYFLTYTVTTTGFGELPYPFTEAQRMWGIVSLYAGVISWFYALGSIVGLVQNPDFQRSVAERRFAKRITRTRGTYVIVCGFGNTGALLTRGLSDARLTVVVVDSNPERIKKVTMRDYGAEVMGLCADARVPEHLIEAGILQDNCKAIVALTQDEEVNLKITVAARLLNPKVWAITQSTSVDHEQTLSTLGENVHIIDPFQTYAKYLGATIHNPKIHILNQWLAGTPGARLDDELKPPVGRWIICGFGRMGHWIREALEVEGIETAIIEPTPRATDRDCPNLIVGRADQTSLTSAGIDTAAGIVAGTNNDSDNLSILLNARALNPKIFFVVRQNRYRNQVVFHAAKADLIMMPSLVSARRILFLLIAPMLKTMFEGLRGENSHDKSYNLDAAVDYLQQAVGGSQPKVWTIEINKETAPAVLHQIAIGNRVNLEHLVSDHSERGTALDCVPLVVSSGSSQEIIPPLTTSVKSGDQILFCGSQKAQWLVEAVMQNDYTLQYILSGVDAPRSWAFSFLSQFVELRFWHGK